MKMRVAVAVCVMAFGIANSVSTSLAQENRSAVRLFTSTDGVFQFRYPGSLVRCEGGPNDADSCRAYFPICLDSEQSQATIACFAYPAQKYKGYNFQAAAVSVNLLGNLKTETRCLRTPELVSSKAHTEVIHGVAFKASEGGEAGLGNYKDQHVYWTYHGQKCYELQVSIALSNFANFDPGTIKEFNAQDQKEVYGRLRVVVETFRFLK